MAVSVWNIILMRTFFQMTIPQELYDSAEMDGSGELRTMFRIILPLSGPIFAVVILNWAVWIWNSYYYALIYLRSNELQPLQIILRQILIMNQNSIAMSADEMMRRQGLVDVLRYALIVVASAPPARHLPLPPEVLHQGRDDRLGEGLIARFHHREIAVPSALHMHVQAGRLL